MSKKPIIAKGAVTEQSVDGTAWEKIPGCKSVVIPTVETDWQESTSLDNDDDFKDYVPGLQDGGVISVPCNYTPDGYEQQLAAEAGARTSGAMYYRTTLRAAAGQTSGDVFEFRGYPTPAVEGNDLGALVGMTVSIRTTGGLSWTKGAAAV